MNAPLRPSNTKEQAILRLQNAANEAATQWMEGGLPLLAAYFAQTINHDQLIDGVLDLVDDIQEDVVEQLVLAIDDGWDFSQSPGGMIGDLLEGVDEHVWRAIVAGAGEVVAPLIQRVRKMIFPRLDERIQALRKRLQSLQEKGAPSARITRIHMRVIRLEKRAAFPRNE